MVRETPPPDSIVDQNSMSFMEAKRRYLENNTDLFNTGKKILKYNKNTMKTEESRNIVKLLWKTRI